jgi:hypothetical protein
MQKTPERYRQSNILETLEESVAFILKMASFHVGQTQRVSINGESSGSSGVGVKDTETPSLNNQEEERHECRSL